MALRAGGEIQRLAQTITQHRIGREGQLLRGGTRDLLRLAEHVAVVLRIPAARVQQQLPHGDLLDLGIDRRPAQRTRLAQQRIDRIVQGKLPLIDQVQHGSGRDRLGDAGGREERVEGHGLAGLDVGQAVAPGHQQLAVFGDRQGPAGNSAGFEGLVHDVVKDRHSLADRRGTRFAGRGRLGRRGSGRRGCDRGIG